MKTAVFFGGASTLDFHEVRLGLCRIPEIGLKIEEAQKFWDKECNSEISLKHVLQSDNTVFFNSINLKSLIHAVVQIGLYERFARKNKAPHILIGDTKCDPALLVCSGEMSLKDLVTQSRACSLQRPLSALQMAPLPTLGLQLNGQSLPRYEIYADFKELQPLVKTKKEVTTGKASMKNVGAIEEENLVFKSTGQSSLGIEGVLQLAFEQFGVREIIHVGPGAHRDGRSLTANVSEEMRWIDSIDLDPMLNWFWADIRKHENLAI
jgi:hypothetical protein